MQNRREFIVKTPLGLAGLVAGATWSSRLAIAQAGPVTIAFPADVPNWDPISAGSAFSISVFKCVFDKPINLMSDLSIGPSIVETHRWLDKEGRTLELNLRAGATFHNGDPVTSEDLKFTFFDRPTADAKLSIAGSWLSRLVGIDTPTPTRAIFRFKESFAIAPQLLGDGTAYIMPKKYFEKVGRDGFMAAPIGSGPYKLVDYRRDSRIVLEAYDKYWGGPAQIKRVTFQIMKDTSARIAAIQAGQVDFVSAIPVREVARLDARPGLVAAAHPITEVVMIQMINEGVFKDQNLRLAMHHAIDKAALSKAFFGDKAEPLSMWAGKGMPANDPGFTFPYSPDLARALLAKSGYSPEKPIKIDVLTFNGRFPGDYDVARAIVQMWRRVGIDAALETIDPNKYNELTRVGKLPAPTLYSWFNSTGDPTIYSGWLMDPTRIFSVWKSDDVMPKLQPLLNELDYSKRMAGYRAFDRWIVEQGYALPLLQGTTTVVHSERVKYKAFRNGWVLPYYWTAG